MPNPETPPEAFNCDHNLHKLPEAASRSPDPNWLLAPRTPPIEPKSSACDSKQTGKSSASDSEQTGKGTDKGKRGDSKQTGESSESEM
eukprot:9160664-Alexandrium_andersonii.AAC.1